MKTTEMTIKHIFTMQHGYIADPHGAIGYAAIKHFQINNPDYIGIYLETAHPAKFLNVLDDIFTSPIEIPHRLKVLSDKEKKADLLPADFEPVKDWLLKRNVFN